MSLFSKLSHLVAGVLLGFLLAAPLKVRATEPKVWVLIAAFVTPDGSQHLAVRNEKGTRNPTFYATEAACLKQQTEDLALILEVAQAINAVQAALQCVEVDRVDFLRKTGVVFA